MATQTEPKEKTAPAAARPGMVAALFVLAPFLFIAYNSVLLYFVQMYPWWLFQFIRLNYGFNTLAMPAYLAFCGMVGFFCAWRRNTQLPPPKLRLWSTIAIVTALLFYGARVWATDIEPNLLQVRRVTISTPKLTAPLRVLHITDIQSDYVGRREERAFEIMRGLNPDLVIFTGDLLQPLKPATMQTERPKMDKLLRSLTPRLGIVAVGGDVDLPNPPFGLSTGIGGMLTLVNAAIQIDTGDGRLNVFGLGVGQSHSAGDFHPEVNGWFAKAPPADFTILLGHSPNYILTASEMPIDLCLAGHTHGGQIRIPFFGPPVTQSNVPRELARGLHKVGKTRLNVSAGIGGEHMAGIPIIRVNCPPEMTLIELVPAK
ncbi:metallophosphoesterase [bacterium]|nr:metallophosphoesterase [bacterium]